MPKSAWVTGAILLGAYGVCGAESFDVTVGAGPQDVPSLAHAVARVRAARAQGTWRDRVAVIGLRAGRFPMTAPVTLTPEDSHLRIVGQGPAESVLDGGETLPPFRVGASGFWEADVPPNVTFDQVWVGRRRAVRARTPNRFYFYMKDVCYDAPNTAFYAEPQEIAPLAALSPAERDRVVVAYWQSWDMGHARLKAVDAVRGRLDFHTQACWPFFYWHKTRPRYVLENYRGALDAPGEWYHDVAAGKLLYVPRADDGLETARAIVPRARELVVFAGDRARGRLVEDVTFAGIGFEHTALEIGRQGLANFQAAMNVRGAALGGQGVENLHLVNCRVAHTGAHGLMLSQGSRHVTVEHALFEDLGAGAIGFSGTGDPRKSDAICEHLTVRDCILRHGGREVQGAIGVWIGHARDCLVEHNAIYDFYYTGISCGWTWGYAETVNRRNRIAFNRVHHIGQGVLSDMGAVYTLGDNGRSEVCNNWVSDVDGYRDNGSPTFGLYTDEGSRGFLFASNLVENCRYCALHQHYGRDNAFVNNLCVGFENCAVLRSRNEPHVTMAMTNNVFWWRTPETKAYTGWGGFEAMTRDLPCAGNVYWCEAGALSDGAFQGRDWTAWRKAGQDRRGAVADPRFRDPGRGDWRVQEDSPALKAGFVPFDWRAAGVLPDDPAWVACAAERTWDEYEALPRAPEFRMSRYDFDAGRYLASMRQNGTRPMCVYTTGRAKGAFTQTPEGDALRLTDSPEEKYAFAPHFKFWPDVTGDVLAVSFTLRPVAGETVDFEIRDWEEDKGGIKYGVRCRYEKGRIHVNGRALLAVPYGMWVTVELRLDFTAGTPSPLAVSVRRADGGRAEASYGKWLSAEFRRPTWYGFMTYGDGGTIWDLKHFSVKASGE